MATVHNETLYIDDNPAYGPVRIGRWKVNVEASKFFEDPKTVVRLNDQATLFPNEDGVLTLGASRLFHRLNKKDDLAYHGYTLDESLAHFGIDHFVYQQPNTVYTFKKDERHVLCTDGICDDGENGQVAVTQARFVMVIIFESGKLIHSFYSLQEPLQVWHRLTYAIDKIEHYLAMLSKNPY